MKWEEFLGRLKGGGWRGVTPNAAGPAPKPGAGAPAHSAGQVARTTFRIFKNNLLALPWIKDGEELSAALDGARADLLRSRNAYREEHTSELQSHSFISYAVFCLKK